MSSLIDLAQNVMSEHGWKTQRQTEIAKAHLDFDLVAESDTAIVFFDSVAAGGLGHRANALSAAVAAVTLQRTAGIKAWEAYLVLIVADDYSAADTVAQAVQRDLNYCRKVVIDGGGIADAGDSRVAMESALSFLFPLDVAAAPVVEDVRQHLIDLITEHGYAKALVSELVNAFDSEADCKCWDRIMRFRPAGGTE